MTSDRFATLKFDRKVTAPLAALWQAWLSPSARALWAAPAPSVTVDFLESDPKVGGREVSICRVEGEPDIRVEGGWLDLDPKCRSVSYEVVSCEGVSQSAALVTASFQDDGPGSRIEVTVQLSSLAEDMRKGYEQGFGAGLANLGGVAERVMVLEREINAPAAAVYGAWSDPEALPKWWGPDGFSCRTDRIALTPGGEWVFDMIAADGTVFPNHHKYSAFGPDRIAYTLHWGENGPKHADAWAEFIDLGGKTRVILSMAFVTQKEHDEAKGFGAYELGLQTLGKLAKHVGAP